MSRSVLALAAAAVLLAGCGGSSTTSTGAAAAPTAGRSATAASTPAPAPGGSAAAGTSGAGRATVGPSAAGAAAAAGTTGQVGDDSATRTAFTAPGTYTYDSTGTVSAGTPRDASGTSTLTVDPPSGGQQHTLLGNDQGRTEQYVVVRPDGTYLVRLVITNPAFSKDFRPVKPVLLVPDPATAGRSWSWTAKSTDGKTTVAASVKIGGRQTLTVGGQSTPTTILDSTLRITGDVTYTATMKTWYDGVHRLIAKEHTTGKGTFNGVQFTTDIDSVLRSTKPS